MKQRLASLFAGVLITAAAVWWLVTPEVAADFRLVVAAANWWMLGIALLVSAAIQWLRAWRFAMITYGSLALPDRRLVRIAFQLNFLNFTLPFRLGELGFPVLMQRACGEPLMRSAGVLVLARLFDLCSVGAILAATAAALGLAGTRPLALLFWAVAVACVFGPLALILGTDAGAAIITRFASGRAGKAVTTADTGMRGARFAAAGLSFLIWFVFGAMAALTAVAVGGAVSPGVALLGASAGNLAFALPINGIGGLGPSQAAWVAVVTRAGVAWSDAVVSALALYAVTFISALGFGGAAMICGQRKPTPA